MNVQSNEKIRRIYDATIELVYENGLHATPMAKIAKLSKTSAGIIYHYFENKEALINALYKHVKKEVADAVYEEYLINEDFELWFSKIWRNYFNYLTQNPQKMSFIEQGSNSPVITDKTNAESEKYMAPITNFLIEGMNTKLIRQMDFYLIIYLINGSVISAAKLKLSGLLEMNEEQIIDAIRFCWQGIKA